MSYASTRFKIGLTDIEIHNCYFDELDITDQIDVIITSPPYNRSKDYGEDRFGDIISDAKKGQQYWQEREKDYKKAAEFLKNTGIIFLNIGHAMEAWDDPWIHAQKLFSSGLTLMELIVWGSHIDERIGPGDTMIQVGSFIPPAGERALAKSFEFVWMFGKTLSKIDKNNENFTVICQYPARWGREKGTKRPRGNLWIIPHDVYGRKANGTSQKPHPAMFPVGLPRRCLALSGANKETIVMDPYGGSGTTAIAGVAAGVKKVILVEPSTRSFSAAIERIKKTARVELSIFIKDENGVKDVE